MQIEAGKKYYMQLNEEIKGCADKEITINGVLGQRYIGTGVKNKNITVYGTPGNAMGAYLNQCDITVYGNVQDAVGDTMDNGTIVVHGSAGDTLGYGMRGGAVYVKGGAGYRVGIHMKAYLDHQPVIVIGGRAGSFLGEYQAGGTIVVLGLDAEDDFPAGNYCGTGMHGGAMYIRSSCPPAHLAEQVDWIRCEKEDLEPAMGYIKNYCDYFDVSLEEILSKPFYKLTPSGGNPYSSLYTAY
ncbi:MAG: glutamate synthase [Eubacterium sp.]|nr:glutamate synthase [Eubacterium sp.]